MASERNKIRAELYIEQLNGTHSVQGWIELFAQILGFLLNRYYLGD